MMKGSCGKNHCVKSIHSDSSCSEETTSDPCYSGLPVCLCKFTGRPEIASGLQAFTLH